MSAASCSMLMFSAAHETHDLEIFKLRYLLNRRVVTRREVVNARLEPCGLGAQLRYSCVQSFSFPASDGGEPPEAYEIV